MNLTELIENNAVGILSAILSFVVCIGVLKSRLSTLEGRVVKIEETLSSVSTQTVKQEQDMRSIHRRLDALDAIKIEAQFAEIQARLAHIQTLLESRID